MSSKTRNDIFIDKFKMPPERYNFTALLVGPRGTGKTTLQEDFLFHLKDRYDIFFALTPTKDTADMFRKHIPDAFVYTSFDKDVLEDFYSTLESLKNVGEPRSAIVFLDDCAFDKKTYASQIMTQIHYNGRHLMALVNSVQDLMDVPLNIRRQYDYTFCLMHKSTKSKRRLYDDVFGIFPSFQVFDTVFKEMTNDRTSLILDCVEQSSDIEQCVFFYKAETYDGCQCKNGYWEDEWDEESREYKKMRCPRCFFKCGKKIFWKLYKKFKHITPKKNVNILYSNFEQKEKENQEILSDHSDYRVIRIPT